MVKDVPLTYVLTIRRNTEPERERRGGTCSKQPEHRRLVPHGQLEGGPAGADRRTARHPPEHSRSRCRLSCGIDRLRPAAAADQRTPELSAACRRLGVVRSPYMDGREDLAGCCVACDMLVCTFQSTGASHPVPAAILPVRRMVLINRRCLVVDRFPRRPCIHEPDT